MATSRFIFPLAAKVRMLAAFGVAAHVRIFKGTLTPSEALATLADFSAHECTHADYDPVDIDLTVTTANNVATLDPEDAVFNGGNPTTLGGKYIALFMGAAADATPATPVICWCDGAANQISNASASAANPSVITAAGHTWSNGDSAMITRCPSNRYLVGRIFPVASVGAGVFTLTGLDLSAAGGATQLDLLKLNDTTEKSAAADIAWLQANALTKR